MQTLIAVAREVRHSKLGDCTISDACLELQRKNPDPDTTFVEHDGDAKEVSKRFLSFHDVLQQVYVNRPECKNGMFKSSVVRAEEIVTTEPHTDALLKYFQGRYDADGWGLVVQIADLEEVRNRVIQEALELRKRYAEREVEHV